MLLAAWNAAERRLTHLFAAADRTAARAAAGTVLWLVLLAGQALAMGERPPREVAAHDILATAEKYLGTPYHYGSRDQRMDCSGFVQRVFEEHGIKLPRSSVDQARIGEPVAWNALRPGDLVFFHTNDGSMRVSHVGIVLGNGQMIHASTSKQRVSVDSLDLSYYVERRVVARRLPQLRDLPSSSLAVYRAPGRRELLHLAPHGRGIDDRGL